jgi:lactoylglutathione lyase
MASISGLSHVGIQVSDLDRSVRFYKECFGLEEVARWTKCEPYVQRLVGYYPDLTLAVAILRLPGSDAFLEILEYRGVPRTAIDPATANPGTGHFCLYVEDLDALYAQLTAKGVEFVSEVQSPTAGPNTGGRVVYAMDPDGIRIELLQTRVTLTGEPRA